MKTEDVSALPSPAPLFIYLHQIWNMKAEFRYSFQIISEQYLTGAVQMLLFASLSATFPVKSKGADSSPMDVKPVRLGSFVSNWWTTCKGNSWLQTPQSLEAQNSDGNNSKDSQERGIKNFHDIQEVTRRVIATSWYLWNPVRSEVCMCNPLMWERPGQLATRDIVWCLSLLAVAHLTVGILHILQSPSICVARHHFWQHIRGFPDCSPTLEARQQDCAEFTQFPVWELKHSEVVSGKRPMTCQAENLFISDTFLMVNWCRLSEIVRIRITVSHAWLTSFDYLRQP